MIVPLPETLWGLFLSFFSFLMQLQPVLYTYYQLLEQRTIFMFFFLNQQSSLETLDDAGLPPERNNFTFGRHSLMVPIILSYSNQPKTDLIHSLAAVFVGLVYFLLILCFQGAIVQALKMKVQVFTSHAPTLNCHFCTFPHLYLGPVSYYPNCSLTPFNQNVFHILQCIFQLFAAGEQFKITLSTIAKRTHSPNEF